MNFFRCSVVVNFLLLWLSTCLLIWISSQYILNAQFFERSGEMSLPFGSGQQFIGHVLQWSYIFEGVYLFVKVTVITGIIGTGFYLNNLQIGWRKLFLTVCKAEYLFVLSALIKSGCFIYFKPAATLSDWHQFYPLSLLSFFPGIGADWYYPLQILNLFEVAYWFAIAYGISKQVALNFDDSLKIVIVSYVPALFTWTACVIFVTLVMFPSQG